MISLECYELDLSLLIELLKTDEIFLVELGILDWNHSSFLIIVELEPGWAWWVDNGIIIEHRELNYLEIRK